MTFRRFQVKQIKGVLSYGLISSLLPATRYR